MFLYHLVWVVRMVPHTKDAETPVASSSLQAGCLSYPSLVLKAWVIPGELLVSSIGWKAKEGDFNSSKETGQAQDGWTCQQSWQQADKKQCFILPCPFIRAATRRNTHLGVGVPASNNQTKEVPHRNAHSFIFYFITDLIKWQLNLVIASNYLDLVGVISLFFHYPLYVSWIERDTPITYSKVTMAPAAMKGYHISKRWHSIDVVFL